ncbi:MAG: hypothetical protein KC492_45540 [Myxococcales bacterium]|nr:hypothetical protein [Myxococcales bacterium]
MRLWHLLVFKLGLGIALIVSVCSYETEYTRFKDPSGRYEVVVTSRLIHSLLPTMPGQAGDKPGFVTIRDAKGSLGRAPVEMVSQAYELQWLASGASIPLVCEWDFHGRRARVLEH